MHAGLFATGRVVRSFIYIIITSYLHHNYIIFSELGFVTGRVIIVAVTMVTATITAFCVRILVSSNV